MVTHAGMFHEETSDVLPEMMQAFSVAAFAVLGSGYLRTLLDPLRTETVQTSVTA